MKNYKFPLTSLFLVFASACNINSDIDADVDTNINNHRNNNSAGAGGGSVLPPLGNGGAGGNSNAGTDAGGSASVNNDAGVDSGVIADAGSSAGGVGGAVSFIDAGVDAAPDVQPVPRTCDTPAAIGSDKGNWFTTNTLNKEFRSHWFQLIDANGFVDSCTYVGRIKWYHPEVDQLNKTWYVSDGMWDNPTTILTINFNDDGSVADRSAYPDIYPSASFSYENCNRAYEDAEWEGYGSVSILKPEYELKYCFRTKTSYNFAGVVGMFRGEWDDSFQKPVLSEPVREPLHFP